MGNCKCKEIKINVVINLYQYIITWVNQKQQEQNAG